MEDLLEGGSVADPGCFIWDPGSRFISIPNLGQTTNPSTVKKFPPVLLNKPRDKSEIVKITGTSSNSSGYG
jgi:hypothetical protein